MQNKTIRRLALTVPALVALAAPGQAAAAETAKATSSTAAGMRYDGTSGDDSLVVTLAASTFTLDGSGPIQAGPGCASVAGDATKVTCVVIKDGVQLRPFEVNLREGNDTVKNATANGTAIGVRMHAVGGTGGDVLFGGKADDELQGGAGVDHLDGAAGGDHLDGGSGDDGLFGRAGTDRLEAGGGRDVLDGGESDDQLDGGLGADIIDGGPTGISQTERHDRVTYGNRLGPVKVDLASTEAIQGEPGEQDKIVDVEDVVGGRGNDSLLGNADNNFLFGGDGNDFLAGQGGLDVLTGGAGADVLFGSPGDGFIGVMPDGVADIMDCSNGTGGPIDAGDMAFRELADDDTVIKCAQVFDA